MSRMTQLDVDLMNYGTTEAVDAYGYEPDHNSVIVFCKECKETINYQMLFEHENVRCSKCGRFFE